MEEIFGSFIKICHMQILKKDQAQVTYKVSRWAAILLTEHMVSI